MMSNWKPDLKQLPVNPLKFSSAFSSSFHLACNRSDNFIR